MRHAPHDRLRPRARLVAGLAALLAAAIPVVGGMAACRAPTEITIELTTDVKCTDVKGTSITIGDLPSLDGKPSTTVTAACDPQTGRIGSMVIVPSGSKDDVVAIKVVLGVQRDPAECIPPAYGPGCIVARRALHFISSSSLTVPIFMGAVCSGIPCNATQTCVGGNCASATIDDPSRCETATGCGESVLTGTSTSTSTDAAVPDDAADGAVARDASVAPDAADAAPPIDAGPPLPTDPGTPTVYVVSDRFWTYDPVAGTWAGSTLLPTAGCPTLQELAVDPFGVLFATGNTKAALYRVDPSTLTCVQLGAGGAAGSYPDAMTFAPRGTLDPSYEVLVGYQPNGDYVRIDTVTGAIETVTPAALGGFTVGDVMNIGSKGYVVMTGGSCGTSDCLWEISLATGAKIGATPLGNIPSTVHVNALGQWAGKLYAYAGPDQAFRVDPANPAAATPIGGPPGYIQVNYRGAGSRTIAPTH